MNSDLVFNKLVVSLPTAPGSRSSVNSGVKLSVFKWSVAGQLPKCHASEVVVGGGGG